MKASKFFLVLLCFLAIAGYVYAGTGNGDDSLNKLLDGNKRFVTGEPAKKDLGDSKRKELTKGQSPFAIVLSCSDSRVPPEHIFDQGLGDIFVIRVAGNVVQSTTLGSIEYGAEHLHSPLLVILGHTQCGAVTATLEATGKPEGNIGDIIRKIMPAANMAKKTGKDKDEILNIAIKENVKNVYKDVMKSKIISHLVHEGKLKIVGAVYDLASGNVELIDLRTPATGQHHMHGHK